nr:MAG TPA: ferredoxin I [Caudoviricetes sp.]
MTASCDHGKEGFLLTMCASCHRITSQALCALPENEL